MIRTSSLGMPRLGKNIELHKFIDKYIVGKQEYEVAQLEEIGKKIRQDNWKMQIANKIDIIPCNDFSFYDHVLDTSVLLGNIPRRYYWEGGSVPFSIYFSMIFGQQLDKFDIKPMQKSRWYDTNYDYIAPELFDPVDFVYSDNKVVLHFLEAKRSLSVATRPSLMGPMSYILMSKIDEEDQDEIGNCLNVIPDCYQVYEDLIENCSRLGISDLEFYEPCLSDNLDNQSIDALREFYGHLIEFGKGDVNIHMTLCYGDSSKNFDSITDLGFSSIHIDCLKTPDWKDLVRKIDSKTDISLGLIDANSLWASDLRSVINEVQSVKDILGGSDRVIVAPSSSMFLCPVSACLEKKMPDELSGCLAFTEEKLKELNIIKKAINNGLESVKEELEVNDRALVKIKKINEKISSERTEQFNDCMRGSFKEREKFVSIEDSGINVLPTAMMSSVRCDVNLKNMRKVTSSILKIQEEVGFDILSTCEIDRNGNSFEYFCRGFDGVYVVQKSYSMRSASSVYNPIIVYDKIIENDKAEDFISIIKTAKNETTKPLKYSLQGAVSMTNFLEFPSNSLWNNVFHDCANILQHQIRRLQSEGIHIISINEEFFLKSVINDKDGLMLKVNEISKIFQKSVSSAANSTKIYLHIESYDFDDIMEVLADCDADVLFINGSKSDNKITDSLMSYRYPYGIGIGVFDANSHRVSTKAEIGLKLKSLRRALDDNQIFVSTYGTFGPDMESMKQTLAHIVEVVSDIKSKL